MRRFFAEGLNPDDKKVELRGAEFVHLKKVLRLAQGAQIVVFNGRGLSLNGVIEAMEKDRAVVKLKGGGEPLRESPVRLILIQGLPKGEKTDLIIQKATELGVSEVRFYASRRAVSKMPSGKEGIKTQRWRRIAIEAAKQCGRSVVPDVAFFEDLALASTKLDGAMKIALWENEKAYAVSQAMKNPLHGNAIAALVGPEGGLPDEEIEDARRLGFTPVKFGPRTLRAETAAIAVLAVLQHALGDIK
ncbi:MAG: 16S rRNA (uracil(1498)-N(3))-methyltransferase [Deltaproteobacteria bacterium]|nr:16S rRNA (uracil(1498)-N(3))-methyltransferase [Deltaproteobacteria bacterium]